MSGVNPNSSVITLYEYELKLQLKGRHWQNGQETCFSYVWSMRDTLQIQKYKQIKVKGQKKIYHTNSNQKRDPVIILMYKKLQEKKVNRDKEEYFRMIQVSIHQLEITVMNKYASNNKAPKYMKQKQN